MLAVELSLPWAFRGARCSVRREVLAAGVPSDACRPMKYPEESQLEVQGSMESKHNFTPHSRLYDVAVAVFCCGPSNTVDDGASK